MKETEPYMPSGIDNNPDDGKHGIWIVRGIRHTCLARASSAREAWSKASGVSAVGDWELTEIRYIGAELPEVFCVA